jgi:hypothetical protein
MEDKMTLTKKEQELLARTKDNELLIVFPKSKYGYTRRELRAMKKEIIAQMQIPPKSTVEVYKEKKLKAKERMEKKELVEKIEKLERELQAAIQISSTPQVYKIVGKSGVKIEAVPFIIASDWHIDEYVKPQTVSNLNEFNLEIAEKRIQNFFRNSVKLLEVNSADTRIKQVVFALLGDFISGNIHEEIVENTHMRPIEAILWVQEKLVAGIKYFLANTDYDYIIVCHQGNHPRITKKVHFASESGNSLEYFMYHNMRNVFKNEKRLTWIIADGYHTYLEVFGKTIRFHHGHAIKFNKNVGGIFPTVYKAIMQWNKARPADYDVFGHFHQMRNGGNFICNGSLIGYNAFAIFITAEYEKPKQKFFMLASNGEIIGEFPIFLE